MFNSLKKLFFRSNSLENPSTPLNLWAAPNNTAGVQVDEVSCFEFPPVYAAINRISTDVASLSCKIYEYLPGGGKAPAVDHPCYDLITTTPDGIFTGYRFRQTMMQSVLSWGNAYSEIVRNGAGVPVRLQWLPPHQVKPEIINKQLVYKWQGPEGIRHIPYFNMIHIACMGNGLEGFSPIRQCRESIALGVAAEVYGASFFGNAARPSGVLTSTKELKEQARKNLKEGFQRVQGGPQNAGQTILLEDGVSWSPISIPPADAELLAVRQFSTVQIAQIFSLPPHKIGDYSRATFSNIEEANQDYLDTSIRSWCDNIESELNLKLFSKEERKKFFIRHGFEGFLRANSAARTASYVAGKQWGYLNTDEIREQEGMNPLPNGEGQIFITPMNMQPTTNIVLPPTQDEESKKMLAALLDRKKYDEEDEEDDRKKKEEDEEEEASRCLVLHELNRLVRREVTAIRRAAAKPGFKQWVGEFYGDHENLMVESLAPAARCYRAFTKVGIDLPRLASSWCQESQAALLGIEEVTTGEQRGQVIEELLSKWEKARGEKVLGEHR